MLPSYQCFEADDFAADASLWLKMQYEPFAAKTLTQILQQGMTITDLPVHLTIKEAKSATPFFLGPKERRIRASKDGISICSVGRKHCYSHAYVDAQSMPLYLKMIFQGIANPANEHFGCRGLRSKGSQQCKLVSVTPRNEDICSVLSQSFRDLP